MDKELVTAWIAALRSGEYEQGRRMLHPDGTFCCLGVAHDLLVSKGLARWKNAGGMGLDPTLWYLPDAEATLFGLTQGHMEQLARANDDGWSFADIANVIEAKILNAGEAA